MILQSGAGNDGILGKEAYEAAANIADETLSSMPTIASFGGEIKAAKRYESHLGEAEDSAIRQVRVIECVNECGLLYSLLFDVACILGVFSHIIFIIHLVYLFIVYRARS